MRCFPLRNETFWTRARELEVCLGGRFCRNFPSAHDCRNWRSQPSWERSALCPPVPSRDLCGFKYQEEVERVPRFTQGLQEVRKRYRWKEKTVSRPTPSTSHCLSTAHPMERAQVPLFPVTLRLGASFCTECLGAGRLCHSSRLGTCSQLGRAAGGRSFLCFSSWPGAAHL